LFVLRGARDAVAGKAAAAANDIAQENQAVKKQKLDDGRTRQVLSGTCIKDGAWKFLLLSTYKFLLWPDIKRQDKGAATQGKRRFSRKHRDDTVFHEEAP
jgi:hypothetical protein